MWMKSLININNFTNVSSHIIFFGKLLRTNNNIIKVFYFYKKNWHNNWLYLQKFCILIIQKKLNPKRILIKYFWLKLTKYKPWLSDDIARGSEAGSGETPI